MNKTSFFITLLLATFFISQNSFAVRKVGNGGNEIALDFLKSAKQVLAIYGKELQTFPQLKKKNLRLVLEKTTVLASTSPLQVEILGKKQDVTAVNFNNPYTIIVNEQRWTAIKSDTVKEALALHELLGLVGVEKTGKYFISKNYLVKNGINCARDLCENEADSSPKETFCRFQNNWYPSLITYKYRFLCKGPKPEFTVYCDLWKDPVEFNGNKIDALGGLWEERTTKGGFLNYTYPDSGYLNCTYEDTKDE